MTNTVHLRNYRAAIAWIDERGARIVEEVHTKGEARLNVILPDGTPKTIRCDLPGGP
jgi:hypothetical protein